MIETERTYLRPFTMSDQDFYASLWGDPDIVRYIGDGKTRSDQEAIDRLANHVIPSYRNGYGYGLQAIVYKSNDQLIGQAGLLPKNVDGKREIEIGYWLIPSYWGKGLAKEVALSLRDYGFRQIRCPRLICLINPNNPASIFVARRIGMSYQKTTQWNGITALVYGLDNPE